jgi:hypothetical protein
VRTHPRWGTGSPQLHGELPVPEDLG